MTLVPKRMHLTHPDRRHLTLIALTRCAAVIAASHVLFGQSPGLTRTFDVVSVKPHAVQSRRGIFSKTTIEPLMVQFSVTTVLDLIQYSYALKSRSQIQGRPGWVEEEHFDVIAKTDAPATPREQRRMMQAVLADRFGLICQLAKQPMQSFILTAPKATKLKRSELLAPSPINFSPVHSRRGDEAIFTYTETGVTLADVADWLWTRFARPVVDETGLSGLFDFKLEMTDDQAMGIDTWMEVMQNQLGLKVSTGRRMIDTLTMEKLSRPSEN